MLALCDATVCSTVDHHLLMIALWIAMCTRCVRDAYAMCTGHFLHRLDVFADKHVLYIINIVSNVMFYIVYVDHDRILRPPEALFVCFYRVFFLEFTWFSKKRRLPTIVLVI